MIQRTSLALLTAVLIPAVLACSAGNGKNDGTGGTTLGDDSGASDGSSFDIGAIDGATFQEITITPSNAVLTIDQCESPPTLATQHYTAKLDDGTDVTAEIMLTLSDAGLGMFTGSDFTSADKLPGGAVGTTTVIKGTARGKTGSANLTLVSLRKACDNKDFFFLEPYKLDPTPSKDVLKFGTNIKQVDLAFNVDTTGSMGGAIENFKTNLSTTIFPNLKKAIPSVGLAVVEFKDFGDSPVVGVHQVITTDVSKAQAAAGLLSASGGGDEPEADVCSMMHIVTGKACSTTPDHTPASKTFGGVDFRPGALPVVVNVTDAHWHDEVSWPPLEGYGLEKDLMPAVKKANVRFIGVTEMHYDSSYKDLEDQANYLSDYTDSNVAPSAFGSSCTAGKCCTGEAGAERDVAGPKKQCRLNFQIRDGNGLGDQVVRAIQALSVGSIFDVTAVPANDPTNPGGVDAVKSFVKGLRAMKEGDGGDCKKDAFATKDTDGDMVDDTFIAVEVGQPVCFEVLPRINSTVPPADKAQFFKAFINVVGMPGSVLLDKREVLFLVPPTDPVAR
ncbi:MAG: hypothetical protein ACXVEE_24585 [Polyangiales bacterium]